MEVLKPGSEGLIGILGQRVCGGVADSEVRRGQNPAQWVSATPEPAPPTHQVGKDTVVLPDIICKSRGEGLTSRLQERGGGADDALQQRLYIACSRVTSMCLANQTAR